jgi:hypothetical protein
VGSDVEPSGRGASRYDKLKRPEHLSALGAEQLAELKRADGTVWRASPAQGGATGGLRR